MRAVSSRATIASGALGWTTSGALLDNFAAAVDTGADTMLTARDGRAIAATVLAAIESGQTGRSVEVSS